MNDKANNKVIEKTDINTVFSEFISQLSALDLVLPGSNVYVDGQRATQKNYAAIRADYIAQLPTVNVIPSNGEINANDVVGKLVDAAIMFNQIRKVNVNVWYASGNNYMTVTRNTTINAYVSMISNDIQQVVVPNINTMTYDFNMFANNDESKFRNSIEIEHPANLQRGKIIKSTELQKFIADLYNKWKEELDENPMTFNIYSCHSVCHSNCYSNCHSNSRSRR